MARQPSLDESLPGVWRVLRYFAPWIRKERPLIAVSMLALLGGVIVRLAEPWPLKFVLDRIIPSERPPGLNTIPVVDQLDATTLLTVCALSLVMISVLRAWLGYHEKVGFAKIGNRVLRRVRNHVFDHMQRLPLSFHDNARSGDLIVRVTRDVSLLRDVTSTALLPLLANVLVLAGMVVVMLLLQWQLALLAMTVLPLFWFSTSKLSTRIHAAARTQRKREGAMASTAAESISAIKAVQALSMEDVFAEGFASRNSQSQKEDLKAAKLSARLGRTVDVLLAIATALVLWFGAWLVMRSRLTPGDLVVFLTYLKRAFNPAKDFAKYTGRLAKAAAAGERVMTLLQQTPQVAEAPDAVEAPPIRGHVRFENVKFGYGNGVQVLDDIDFEVQPGQTVALTGPSGIGKSTVLSLLLRLYEPTEGRILIDGHDIREWTVASLRRQTSVVLQDTILFVASVRENIACGLPDVSDEKIEEAVRLAGAEEFVLRLPDGYDTVLGERGANLSKGQQQRLALARAAVRDAAILILDEPTTGLDEENQRKVQESILRLAKERTTFLVTHDLGLACRADLVVYIEDGRLREVGPPAALLRRGGRFASLHRTQNPTASRHA